MVCVIQCNMPFVSFANQVLSNGTTALSNIFIKEYLPHCNGDCCRVYIYGLYLCSNSSQGTNTLELFADKLDLSVEDVKSAFYYWHELGLVQVLNLNPIEVKYLPTKSGGARLRKQPKGKYDDFTAQIHSIIGSSADPDNNREITKTELEEYCYFMESMAVEPPALLMIAKYCVNLKGPNVGYKYIINVAKNWAYGGAKTADEVEKRLRSDRDNAEVIANILIILGSKRLPEPTDFELFHKWNKEFGFNKSALLHIAKLTKGGIRAMDNLVTKYHEQKLYEPKEIDLHNKTDKDYKPTAAPKANVTRHSYKSGELDKLFSDIDKLKF